MHTSRLPRRLEAELMDDPEQAVAYAEADFAAPHQAFVEQFARVFPDIDAAHPLTGEVLDLGCGPGDVALRFAAAHPRCCVLGVDAAQAMLDAGHRLRSEHPAGARVHVECRDILAPWFDETGRPRRFGTLISNSLLHHLHEPDRLWQALRRLARPAKDGGSRFFLMDLRRPDSDADLDALVARYAANEPDILRRDFAASLAAALCPEEILDGLVRAGLGDLTVEPLGDRHVVVHGVVEGLDRPAPATRVDGSLHRPHDRQRHITPEPQSIHFTKMHGLGNDFVVIDAVRQRLDIDPTWVRQIADRRRGIGCDQLLIVESARSEGANFRYRIFNADGGEVEHCGNGARCFAAFVRRNGLTDAREITVETLAGRLVLVVERDHPDGLGADVRVAMGVPRFDPEAVPFDATHPDVEHLTDGRYALTVHNADSTPPERVVFDVVGLGNPHAVIEVERVDDAPVAQWGPQLQRHPAFPRSVNVGFVQRLDDGHLRLRVFERGAGETEACGTGATAAMVALARRGLVGPRVEVRLTGGVLMLHWAGSRLANNETGQNESAQMSGPARIVYDGDVMARALRPT